MVSIGSRNAAQQSARSDAQGSPRRLGDELGDLARREWSLTFEEKPLAIDLTRNVGTLPHNRFQARAVESCGKVEFEQDIPGLIGVCILIGWQQWAPERVSKLRPDYVGFARMQERKDVTELGTFGQGDDVVESLLPQFLFYTSANRDVVPTQSDNSDQMVEAPTILGEAALIRLQIDRSAELESGL